MRINIGFFTSNSSTVVTIRGLKATEEGKPASVKVSFEVRKTGKTSKYSYVSKVNVIDDKLTMTAAATGVKKITVTFNKAVDTSKAKITLKKGVSAANVDKVTFTDAKTAVIETSAKLTKGDYTVEATDVADETLTYPVNVEDDEYVANIKITTTEAPMLGMDGNTVTGTTYTDNKTIKVNYELQNQYEEVVSNVSTTPDFVASTGVAVGPTDKPYKNGSGTVYIQSSNVFVPNSEVFINAVLVNGTHVATTNTSVKVALPAKYDKAEFLGVYNTRTKKVETISATTLDKYNTAYYLLFSMIDQYGNAVAAEDDTTATGLGFSVASQNPMFVGVNASVCKSIEYEEKTYQAVQLVGGDYASKGGKATISLISNGTGTTSSYEISSDASSAVEKFTLQSPADIVTADSTVEIPFEALDQSGNLVTAFDLLDGKVDLTSGNSYIDMYFKKQSDGSAKLYIDVNSAITGVTTTQDLPVYSSSVVQSNGNFSSVNYSVKYKSIATTVVGLAKDSKIATTFTDGSAAQTLKLADLNIADQYGRTMKTADVKDQLTGGVVLYAVKVASENAISLNSSTNGGIQVTVATSSSDTGVTISNDSGKTGSAKIAFGISNTSGVAVPASEKEIRFTAESGNLSSYDSYEVATLPTMYVVTDGTNKATSSATDPDWKVAVKVYGVAADGSKILLPSSQFTVDLPTSGVATVMTAAADGNSAWKLTQSATVSGATVNWFKVSASDSTYKDETVDVTVTIFDTNGAQKAVKTEKLTVSNKTPVIKEAKFTSDVNSITNTAYIAKASDKTVSTAALTALIDETTLKDQYGAKDASVSPSAIVISDVKEASDTDAGSFTVVTGTNNTPNANISGAMKNDTFKVTFKYAGGYELSCDVVITD